MRAFLLALSLIVASHTAQAQLAVSPLQATLERVGGEVSKSATQTLEAFFLVNTVIAEHTLACVKVKGGLYVRGDFGVCINSHKEPFILTGTGLGIVGGVAGEVMFLFHYDSTTLRPNGHYLGASMGSSVTRGTRLAMKVANLIKFLPRGVGPDFAVFKKQGTMGGIILLGLQAGPLFDLTASDMRLRTVSELVGLPAISIPGL